MVSTGAVVSSGDVAIHDDGGGQHWAVVLDTEGDQCEALFFTSRPGWSLKSRRATTEELAMAGYVTTRPTYLAYVTVRVWDLEPLGRNFPNHWVESLRQEFKPVMRLRQLSGT